MKTRIIVREFNDGRKEFRCQRKTEVTKDSLGVIFIYILPCFWPILDSLIWEGMTRLVQQKNDKYEWEFAVFNTMEEAKAFIDGEIQKEVDENFANYQKQVKKTFKVKYP